MNPAIYMYIENVLGIYVQSQITKRSVQVDRQLMQGPNQISISGRYLSLQ